MSKGDECRALIAQAGACDILVNNAGIQHVAAIPDFPVEKWDAIIAINLSSAFHTTAAALPMMRAAGWGRVINIASAHGLTASPLQSGLYRGQARDRGADQDHGAGDGGGADHRQRDLSGLRADPAGGGADPRHDEGIRMSGRT
jgi:NAD(P)-dependent dehydrogenase (short-subunit alcohol dehydrogenase family)